MEGTLITTLFYIAGIISAIHAVMSVRTSQGTIAWAVSLIAFPFVAVPAYWVFGRSKFEGFIEAYEERQDEIDALVDKMRADLAGAVVQFEDRIPEYQAVHELAEQSFTHSNRAELLIDGEATFDSILSGIALAEEYVLVEFYMFHDDGLGRRMQQALIERAEAGVRTFMLYDEIGSQGLPEAYLNELRAAGVEVSSFKPTQGWRNRFQLNFRNHRKIVVVDGKTSWVGGHNVGDEYLGLDPDLSPWRDTHVRLDGPVALQLQAAWLADWYWATRALPDLNWLPSLVDDSDVMAMIIPSAPTQQLETAGLFFVNALNATRDRIWLSAPYFVPDEAIMKALELAALRGVDVRIITSGKNDNLAVQLAAFYYIEKLAGLGIRFYEYAPGFLHEKVMLMDNSIASVGTANFDNRSFRLNFEVTALIADEDFAKQMEAMFESDFGHGSELDPETLKDRPFWWRFGVHLSRLAAPVL